jgi:hypothetical protein
MGDRPAKVLDALMGWMVRGENTTIMAVLCLVIGAKLIGDAISGLSMEPVRTWWRGITRG